MNNLIPVTNNDNRITVSGRDLHKFLEVQTQYKDWIKRMIEYGFTENVDFILVAQKRATNNPKNPYTTETNHQLTIDMAKEISMIQRSEKGQVYFVNKFVSEASE